MNNMDPISLKIITELGKDGRISNIKLAKKLGVNVLTVAKRVKVLTEKGIIEIRAMPNTVRMGYHSAFICLNVNQKNLDDICSQLMKIQNINLLVTCFGRFDILLIAIYRDLETLQNLVDIKIPQIAGIHHINQYLISETRKLHYELMTPTDLGTSRPIPLDDINQKLINQLVRDGHPNYRRLAEKLGISTATISRRISFLVKEKMISFRAIPNLTKLGYSASAFVILHTESKKTDMICQQLSGYPEVHLVARLMNDNNALFGVHCSDVGALYELIKTKIANVEGVINSETFIRGPLSYFNASVFITPPSVSTGV